MSDILPCNCGSKKISTYITLGFRVRACAECGFHGHYARVILKSDDPDVYDDTMLDKAWNDAINGQHKTP